MPSTKTMKPLQVFLEEADLDLFRELCPGRRGMSKVTRALIKAFIAKARASITPDPEVLRILQESNDDPQT